MGLVAYLFLGRLYSTSLVLGFWAASLVDSDIVVVYLIEECFSDVTLVQEGYRLRQDFFKSSLITI